MHSLQKHMVRKRYCNFPYEIEIMDLTAHNTVLLDMWCNMLIKFSKLIGSSLAKIINTKVNSRPSKYLRWSFFRKSLLGSDTNSESCQTSKMEHFAKTVKSKSPSLFL